MKQSLLVKIIIGVLILAGVGYSAVWFQQAGTVKENVKAWFASINASDSAKKGELKASYDDVSVSGFPTKFVINITNPSFEYTPEAARTLFFSGTPAFNEAEQTAEKSDAEKEAAVMDSWKLNGTASIDTNPVTHRHELTIKGVSEGVLRDSQEELPWKSNDGSWTMTLVTTADAKFDTLAHLNLMNPEEITHFLKNIREVGAKSDGPVVISQAETGAELMTAEESRFSFSVNAPEEKQMESHGEFVTKGLYMDPQFEEAYGRFIAQMKGVPESEGMGGLFSYASAGKQDIDVSYAVSAPRGDFDLQQDGQVDLTLSSFRLKNDFYDISLPFTFKYNKNGDQILSDWKLDGNMRYSPSFGEALLAKAETTAKELFTGGSAIALTVFGVNNIPDAKEFTNKVATLIPDFEKMGDVKLAVEGGFKGQMVPGNPSPAGTLNMRSVTLSHGLWGIAINGEMVTPENKADISILCTACDTMIENALTYAKNGQELAVMLNKNYKVFPVTPKLLGDVQSFLHTIAKEETDGALLIHLVSDGAGNIMVSEKPFAEVQSLALQTFLPYLMQMQQQQMESEQPAKPKLPDLPRE